MTASQRQSSATHALPQVLLQSGRSLLLPNHAKRHRAPAAVFLYTSPDLWQLPRHITLPMRATYLPSSTATIHGVQRSCTHVYTCCQLQHGTSASRALRCCSVRKQQCAMTAAVRSRSSSQGRCPRLRAAAPPARMHTASLREGPRLGDVGLRHVLPWQVAT
jgi:hypothetical protein